MLACSRTSPVDSRQPPKHDPAPWRERLTADKTLAFALGTHPRLGSSSHVLQLCDHVVWLVHAALTEGDADPCRHGQEYNEAFLKTPLPRHHGIPPPLLGAPGGEAGEGEGAGL
mmetsp:Transcript_30676/g.71680  ORF Transcript_30676/g.71680 Transcript_30676/m.71680 type:complete len:114 (+) Transcript_30676:236-577(+)